MSDAVSRDAVMHLLQEWTYCCDVEDVVRAFPTVQLDARIKEYEEAYQYALHLAEALRDNYPPNPDFRFLGDLVGLLTQIDNMVAGLSQSAVQPDTAPASNLTARGNAATWALYDANLTRMGALQHAVQPDAALLEAACIAAHDAYEVAAHAAGWVTNPQSRKLWSEVPEANKIAMRAGISAALALIDKHAHVNETPKSEHEAAVMLTPATKGGGA